MLKNKDEIKKWLDDVGAYNYTIHDNGVVDVNGDVWLNKRQLREIPVQFGNVSGDFYCGYNNLITLIGSPHVVGRGFYCHFNELKSLEGCPQKINRRLNCNNNKLTSLVGAPDHMKDLDCSYNELTSLAGCPKNVSREFVCWNNAGFERNPFGYKELLDLQCWYFACIFGAVNDAMELYVRDRSPLNKLKVIKAWEESYVKE